MRYSNVRRGLELAAFVALALALVGCRHEAAAHSATGASVAHGASLPGAADPLALIPLPKTPADRIVNRAKEEVLRGVIYDARDVPQGKVPDDRGACTDVVIRSLRAAGFDLQTLMHEDMVRHFSLYPHNWGLTRPNFAIDHRRTRNQIVYLKRFGESLPIATTGSAAATWQPGDLVYWDIGFGGMHHCGVLSNVRNARGLPLVIHNLAQAAQEDCLTSWKIEAHFRFPARSAHHATQRQTIRRAHA